MVGRRQWTYADRPRGGRQTAPPENGSPMKLEFGERITLVALKGPGHAMELEKPRKTAAAIVSFLAKHPITAAR